MKFAICDIETTGSSGSADKIFDIAIVIHNGNHIEQTFHTRINPLKPIPSYIQKLTGISNTMVQSAPTFDQVAEDIDALTKDCIFVAHNVQFDYAFLKAEMLRVGIEFSRKKLCTIKLGRKVFPNLSSHGLDTIIREFNIEISAKDRHTALGDTLATVQFFEILLKNEASNYIEEQLNEGIDVSQIPPTFPLQKIIELPDKAGLVYFHNSSLDVTYILHADNIKQLSLQVLRKNSNTMHKLKHECTEISFELTNSNFEAELMFLEQAQRKLPIYNSKRMSNVYKAAIVLDDNLSLAAVSLKNAEGKNIVKYCKTEKEAAKDIIKYAKIFGFCFVKNNILINSKNCSACNMQGECTLRENDTRSIKKIIYQNQLPQPECIVITKGASKYNKALIHIKNGNVKGFGSFNVKEDSISRANVFDYIKPCTFSFVTQPYVLKLLKGTIDCRIMRIED